MAPARLIDMGIEPFLVAIGPSSVSSPSGWPGGCARTAASDRQVDPEELVQSGFDDTGGAFDAYEPVAASAADGIGYRGRVGLYEVMVLTKDVRSLILRKASAQRDRRGRGAAGMRRLRTTGSRRCAPAITSVPEVLRVVGT